MLEIVYWIRVYSADDPEPSLPLIPPKGGPWTLMGTTVSKDGVRMETWWKKVVP